MIIRQVRASARLREGLLPLFAGRAECVTKNGSIVSDYEKSNPGWNCRPDVVDQSKRSTTWNFFSSASAGPGLLEPRHGHGRHFGTTREQMVLQRTCGAIAPSRVCLADESGGEEQPVRSPLSQAPGPLGSGGQGPGASPTRTAQAILTGIRQSPKKLNLVAEMVRGMRVEDALAQMTVSVKRAAKTVFKVVHSAQANAVHNFGLEKDRLFVREAFVGKDRYLKRVRPHGKGRAGKLIHKRSRLTVILNEMSAEQETDLARLKVLRRRGTRMSRPEARLVPHRLLKTQWSRQRAPKGTANAGLAGN